LHLNDFGLAKSSISYNERIQTTAGKNNGTVAYTAPEILNANG
jgi:serine/threonine protein kinase